ncbi:Acyl-CoA:lysophosphatidylglycerol acyltransferase 1 [Trichuris trichiura]|uniref:Acyl-CoA:lysophosphatidylglycerol acyltransferase 1 n=1 Tax=Trichuris trichiura TaxID=36087 RepID=A0A077ZCI5_TRITR|nr:Acyl-CoA:lysophosphatidylglycerol acyltransferase 1 [Trichuris trichiura]
MSSPWYVGLRACAYLSLTILDNIIFVPSFLATMLFLWPVRRFSHASFGDVSLFVDVVGKRRRLIYCFLTNIHFIALFTATVFEEGDDIVHYFEEPCLVIVNHQSTADVPILVHVINALSGYCYKVRMGFLAKGCFDRNQLVKAQGKESQRYGLGDLRAQLMRKFWPRRRRWIVVFPEGGFLRNRLGSSQRYAKKNGYPVFNYVVLPRTGAMQVVLETCARSPKDNHVIKGEYVRQLRYIIDVTIAYEKDATFGLWEICTGTMRSKKVVLRYRCHDISEIDDHSKEGILSYLCKLWTEKEDWLKAMAEEEGNASFSDKQTIFYQRRGTKSLKYYAAKNVEGFTIKDALRHIISTLTLAGLDSRF